ncbi:MAG TPA: hypothetical protein VJG90_05000 [Candidatus Nanoarchaeia archaeon]|nr:hypothetical protein [Candidatus Nanoarchaeia archaeon]
MKKRVTDLVLVVIIFLGLILIGGILTLPNPTGYITASDTVKMVRCINNGDAFESTQNPNGCEVAGQQFVGPLGWIFKTQQPDTHLLMRCLAGGKEAFTSIDPGCEGQPPVGSIGYIYNTQQTNTVPLYRCYGGGDHLLSLQSNCEGRANEGVVGYVLTAPPAEPQQAAPVLQPTPPAKSCYDEDGKNYFKKTYACSYDYYRQYGRCEPYGITDICPDGSGTLTLREAICNTQDQPDMELIDCTQYGGICNNGACLTQQNALQDYLSKIPVAATCPSDIQTYLNQNMDLCSQQKKSVKLIATYKDQTILDNLQRDYGESANGFTCKNNDGSVTQHIFGCAETTSNPTPTQPNSPPLPASTPPTPISLYRCVNNGDVFETLQSSCEVPGQVFGGKLGDLFKQGGPGLKLLKRCMASERDAMTSLNTNCEGRPYVGDLGYIYTNPAPGTVPLYRCISGGGDHYLSMRQDCMYDYGKVEFVIGHILNPQPEMVNPKYKLPAPTPPPATPTLSDGPQQLCQKTGGLWTNIKSIPIYGAGIGRQVGELGPILGYTECDCVSSAKIWDLNGKLGCVEFGQARLGTGGVRYEQKPYSGVSVTEAPEPKDTQQWSSTPKPTSPSHSCTDSDGKNYNTNGFVQGTDADGPYTASDTCVDSQGRSTDQSSLLIENYCDNNNAFVAIISCPCNNGICTPLATPAKIPEPTTPPTEIRKATCQDSDNKNYRVKGTTTGMRAEGFPIPYDQDDYCKDPIIIGNEILSFELIEYYCQNNEPTHENVFCPCKGGACVDTQTPSPTSYEKPSTPPPKTNFFQTILDWVQSESCTPPTYEVVQSETPAKDKENLITGKALAEFTGTGLLGDPKLQQIGSYCALEYARNHPTPKALAPLPTKYGIVNKEVPVTCHVKPWRLESATELEHFEIPEDQRNDFKQVVGWPGAPPLRRISVTESHLIDAERPYHVAVVERTKNQYAVNGDVTCAYGPTLLKRKTTCNGKPKEELLGINPGTFLHATKVNIPCQETITENACYHDDDYYEVNSQQVLSCFTNSLLDDFKGKPVEQLIRQKGVWSVFLQYYGSNIDPGCEAFVEQACRDLDYMLMSMPPQAHVARVAIRGCQAALLTCKLINWKELIECYMNDLAEHVVNQDRVDCDTLPGAQKIEIS